jgi:hypothetical protein
MQKSLMIGLNEKDMEAVIYTYDRHCCNDHLLQ